MATELVYLAAFDVLECRAKVISVNATDDGRTCVVLDRTCFYPRGGGQDWDTGTITAGSAVFAVQEARLDEQGVVQHIGAMQSGESELQPGAAVDCVVDAQRRATNTRLHSAGHVIDMAVRNLGYDWRAIKGAHYPHMSFVEYDGQPDPEQYDQTREAIEQQANRFVTEGGQSEIRFMPVSQMHTICPTVPDNIPANKPARVVVYNGTFGVPCGGTHVRNLRDIGAVRITKVKCKKGITKVTYAVEGIN